MDHTMNMNTMKKIAQHIPRSERWTVPEKNGLPVNEWSICHCGNGRDSGNVYEKFGNDGQSENKARTALKDIHTGIGIQTKFELAAPLQSCPNVCNVVLDHNTHTARETLQKILTQDALEYNEKPSSPYYQKSVGNEVFRDICQCDVTTAKLKKANVPVKYETSIVNVESFLSDEAAFIDEYELDVSNNKHTGSNMIRMKNLQHREICKLDKKDEHLHSLYTELPNPDKDAKDTMLAPTLETCKQKCTDEDCSYFSFTGGVDHDGTPLGKCDIYKQGAPKCTPHTDQDERYTTFDSFVAGQTFFTPITSDMDATMTCDVACKNYTETLDPSVTWREGWHM